MKPSEDLFNLIKSMSQSEKGYFKKYCSKFISDKDTGYLKLFEAIALQLGSGTYDEEKIRHKYKGERFVKNISVYKNYLFDQILCSLRDYDKKRSASRRYILAIDKALILMERNMFNSARKILTAAGIAASKGEYFLEQLMINNLQTKLISIFNYKGYTQHEQDAFYHSSMDAINKYSNIIEYRHKHNRFYSILRNPGLKNADSIIKELKKIQSDVFFKDPAKSLSLESTLLYLNLNGAYYSNINKPKEALEYKRKSVKLFEQNKEFMKENLKGYVAELINYTYELTMQRKYGEALSNCNKLEKLQADYRDMMNDNIRMNIFCRFTILLFIRIQMGDFEIAIKDLHVIERGLNVFKNKIDKYHEYNMGFYISYAFFGIGDYENALQWLNKIMKKDSNSVNPAINSISRILSLMIHFELENFDVLEYQLPAAFRYLGKFGVLNESLLLFQKYFKLVINNRKSGIENEELIKIRESLKALKNDDIIEDLDIVTWMLCKIENKDFLKAVKEKAGIIPA